MNELTDAISSGEEGHAAVPVSAVEPDEAQLRRLSAQKLWSEGRAKPIRYQCSSWLSTWAIEDRITWQTTDGTWLAQLERSANGRHISMAFYHHGSYVGREDAGAFHQPARQTLLRRPPPAARSLPLPLG